MFFSGRSVALSILSLLFSASAFAQADKPAVDPGNLYSLGLFATIAEMDKTWGSDHPKTQAPTNVHHLVVAQDPDKTRNLPSQSGDFHVEYLDTKELVQRHKKLGKDFIVLRLHSLHNEGSKLTLMISIGNFTYDKKRPDFEIASWSDVEIRYDCEKQNFVVSSVKFGGI